MRRVLVLAWGVGLVIACSGCESGSDPKDAGIDADMDISVDAGADTGLDAATDPGMDVPPRDEGFDPGIEDPGSADDGADLFDPGGDPGDDPGTEDPGAADAPDGVDTDVPSDVCEPPDCVRCPEDDLECTLVYEDPEAGCLTTLLSGWCLVAGECWAEGEVDPENDCWACQPDWDVDDLTPRVDEDCDDRTPCSTGGVCTVDGLCVPAAPICYDGIACTYDRCVNGICQNPEKPGGECDDNNACTYNDHCEDGLCVGYEVACAVDSNPCTDDLCDPIEGCSHPFNMDPCNDSNGCTLGDTCVMGECVGTPKNCDDGDPCTNDSCQFGSGLCINSPHFGACDDGNRCTVSDTCATGECAGLPRVCNDGNACTEDSCDPAVGCVYSPIEGACDDGNPCTVDDVCVAGECAGTPMVCDDGIACTLDECVAGACRFSPLANGSLCDDGNDCTLIDKCSGGVCIGTGVRDCNDSNPCTVDRCENEVGCVHDPAPCDDGNVCTGSACDPAVGCLYDPVPGVCDDDDLCTSNDQCVEGVCTGTPKDCSDGDPCSLDLCNDGVCSHAPNLGACEDGNLCTGGETCVGGQCIGGQPIECNDFSVCTTDSCDPAVGCVFSPIQGDCNDYSVCTVNDKCVAGECVGTAIVCDDGNFCTDNLCDPQRGCWFRNNGLLCNDGNACTFQDQCGGGSCQGFSYFADPVSKAATLVFGTMPAKAGSGLDVDGNAATCAPKNLADPDLNCADGVDNAFANLSLLIRAQFGPQLLDAVEGGAVALMFEHEAPGPGAGPYEMNLFLGQRTVPMNCDPTKAGCNYKVYADTLVGTCAPRFVFDNATLDGNKLTAGGKEHEAIIYLVIGTARVPLTLKWARVEATVTMSGGKITGGTGVLAGAIEKRELLNSLETVPGAQFYPYTRDNVRTNINLFLNPDMDVKGTGVKDYASIGMPFTLVTGHAVGRF
jgi:hypothetical protein